MNSFLYNLNQISLSRQDTDIIKNVSLEIRSGERINIYGKNGSGKTSLLKILSGITVATEGLLEISSTFNRHGDIFYMGHKYGLNNNLSVYDNLKYYLKFKNIDALDIIASQLSHYGLGDYIYKEVKYLSHGQKKIVVLCALRITNYKVWILDEPYTGLDAVSCNKLNEDVIQHTANGGTVIVTSHDTIEIYKNWELL